MLRHSRISPESSPARGDASSVGSRLGSSSNGCVRMAFTKSFPRRCAASFSSWYPGDGVHCAGTGAFMSMDCKELNGNVAKRREESTFVVLLERREQAGWWCDHESAKQLFIILVLAAQTGAPEIPVPRQCRMVVSTKNSCYAVRGLRSAPGLWIPPDLRPLWSPYW